MTQLRQDYADWVVGTRTCAACAGCDRGELANENILKPGTPASSHSIVPQAGYLGSEFEAKRVLVLGKNPGGGFVADPIVYPGQARISDIETLNVETLELTRTVQSWKLMQGLQLQAVTGIKPTEMAYANQIMCRTKEKDIGDLEKKSPAVLRAIYDNCFTHRVLPLLELLQPNAVIVIGRKSTPKSSWPEWFEDNLKRQAPSLRRKIVPITYPSFHFNSTAGTTNAELAREQVRAAFQAVP